NVADGAIILRDRDAKALVAAAFGETLDFQAVEPRLSPLECEVLDRVITALMPSLVTLCGEQRESVGNSSGICEFVAYLELIVDQPVAARLGIALSRDLVPEAVPALTFNDLAELP